MLQSIAVAAVWCAAAVIGSPVTMDSRQAAAPGLQSTYKWTSTGPLIGPKNDTRGLAGIKDPSIVEINGTYHVFASTAHGVDGYNLVYLSFTDFAKAGEATFHYLDQSPLGTGYRAAPQVFWFEPHKLWYLVYQNGNAAYSTNKDIADPKGWTAPVNFYDARPKIIDDHIGEYYWVDMWVVCDATHCYLFSSDDNGQLYRSETTIADFPKGMTNTAIALSDPNRHRVFEAACVYKVADDKYLLLVEAIGEGSVPGGLRYFRSWTSDRINGTWTPLADSQTAPFAGEANVEFPGAEGKWTKSISHGELIRAGKVDQTMLISPCKMRFLYQGLSPNATGLEYNALPWKLALITQTNSDC